MKFSKQNITDNWRPYHVYRDRTREDFKGFCAYCFRHEDEVGGERHFDQDHFEPNASNKGLRRRDYYNLYWSCKECNGHPNKGHNWPSAAEIVKGEIFCDSCHHDPEIIDYKLNVLALDPLTPAGEYTIRIIRLNERTSLKNIREDRQKVLTQYRDSLTLISSLISRAESDSRYKDLPAFRTVVECLRVSIPDITRFLSATPFVLTRFPKPFDVQPLLLLLLPSTAPMNPV